MCYHRYTSHPCGHKSTSAAQCHPDLLPSATLFCDRYEIHQACSFAPCGGTYCKEDKETAHWAENGDALLLACNDELAILSSRILNGSAPLDALRNMQQSWGILHEDEVNKYELMLQEQNVLDQAYRHMAAKRQHVIDSIIVTRNKQQEIYQRSAMMLKQAQEVKAARMRAAQNNQTPSQLSLIAQPQPSLMFTQSLQGTTQQCIGSSVEFDTPCPTKSTDLPHNNYSAMRQQPIYNTIAPRPASSPILPTTGDGLPYNSNNPTPTSHQPFFSPVLPQPAFSPVKQDQPLPSNPEPPKKKRGRPPKVKPVTPSFQEPPVNIPQVITPNDPKPASTRKGFRLVNNKKPSCLDVPSSGTRRSERAKKKISYAESPSPSPERVLSEEPDPPKRTAAVAASKRVSARLAKSATTSKKKKKAQEEDVYLTDGEDGGYVDEVTEGEDDDDDWQGEEDLEVDCMEVAPTRSQMKRSTKKRVAASSPKETPAPKRHATGNYDKTHDRVEQGMRSDYIMPVQEATWPFMETTAFQPFSDMPSAWNSNQAFQPAPNTLPSYHTPVAAPASSTSLSDPFHNMTAAAPAPMISLRGGYEVPETPNNREQESNDPNADESPAWGTADEDSDYDAGPGYAYGPLTPRSRADLANGVGMGLEMKPYGDLLDGSIDVMDYVGYY